MTPDTILPLDQPDNPAASTVGMTTKVVKGSMWTLIAQIAPLAMSLVATPFVIRLLGSESYGIVILVGLIPSYLAFADFGMNLASTKFASEAFADNDFEREGRIVRTAALIALCSSVPIGFLLFFFSSWILSFFNVPAELYDEAALALKITAVTFILNFLNNIFSTPQLTRLRMDLNALISGGFKTLGILATPFAVIAGGIVGAVSVLMVASFLTLLGHLVVWHRFDQKFFNPTIERAAIRPLLKFGVATVGAAIAAGLLINAEKGILAATVSASALAHYSVAFNLAAMVTMFSGSMIQSLIPAFSQLQRPEKRQQLNSLFSRGIRLNLIWLIPALAVLAVIARTFFGIWAGEEFAVESTPPFYLLLVGVAFNILAFLPHAAILSAGRAGTLAALYWIELFFYIAVVWLLASNLGAVGAALAWSVRVSVDAVFQFYLARRFAGTSVSLRGKRALVLAAAIMAVPLMTSVFFSSLNIVVVGVLVFSLGLYSLLVWKAILEKEEVAWLIGQFSSGLARLRNYG